MKIGNRGFTLIELLAAIVLFAIVASIGTFAITSVIKSSKEKNYQLLIKNIESAAEVYYQECKYSYNDDGSVTCQYSGGAFFTTLGGLVTQGYLVGNSKDSAGNYTIVNTKTNASISNCAIGIYYDNNSKKFNILVDTNGTNASCPTSADYEAN